MKENETKPAAAGKSSYDLIDIDKFFKELNLQEGIAFLDVACGRGAYCLAASEIIGEKGRVYEVDLWEEGIDENLSELDWYPGILFVFYGWCGLGSVGGAEK